MAMRLSFTIEPETSDMIDRYAKERGIKREKAVLELIEAGIAHMHEGGEINLEKRRTFEEIDVIKKEILGMSSIISEIKKEVGLIHHIIDNDLRPQLSAVPYQSKKWWDFRKK